MQVPQDQPIHKQRFTARYLDPVDRLAEIVYGVLIVLTFTLAFHGIEFRNSPVEGVRRRFSRSLLAAIGCTVAWGFIDSVMYILTSMFERSERQRLLVEIQHARTSAPPWRWSGISWTTPSAMC